MLELAGVGRTYGGVAAVSDVNLTIASGELVGIIGPNGAGKSTLLGLISGHVTPQHGGIRFDGHPITDAPPHVRARLGIATVFQGARLFGGMTVFENVCVGASSWTTSGAVAAAFRTPSFRRQEVAIRAAAEHAIERVGLGEWAGRAAESLPLGQQRRVQVARALAAAPKLLLLDEPASGLRGEERAELAELIAAVASEGMSVALIEHDVAMVMRLSHRIAVLELGRLIADGTPEQIRADPKVIEAYLGGGTVDAAHR